MSSLEVGSLADKAWEQVEKHTEAREAELGLAFLYFARHFWLEEIDSQWIDHLKAMDQLREGIGLRGYGQKDPKQEYKKEGYNMFMQMTDTISQNVAKKLFLVRLDQQASIETPEQEAEQKLPEFKLKPRRVVLQHQSSATSGAADEKSTRDIRSDDQAEVEGDQTKQERRPSAKNRRSVATSLVRVARAKSTRSATAQTLRRLALSCNFRRADVRSVPSLLTNF
jgi:preprotein translocase subunit SecA